VGRYSTLFRNLGTRRISYHVSPGFTAIVNKELSVKYNELVDKAPELIKVLPWGKDYEVDVFKRPDFTALEIVSFATGGESRRRMICLTF
jgi:hypothetical protein